MMLSRFLHATSSRVRFAQCARVAPLALIALFALALPACDREDPTTIGAPLVENGAVRTFEVTLDASQFLVRDTAFSSFPPPFTLFLIAANTFEGSVNAHEIFRFSVDPFVGVVNGDGEVVVDSTPKLERASLVFAVDTVASSYDGPVLMHLYRLAQTWDTAAVTWTVREMNGTTPVLWSQPGGTRGVLIDTATYVGGDSVTFRVDTATVKLWRDSALSTPGAMLTVERPNTRIRTGRPVLRVDFHTSIGDSTVTQSETPFALRFISDPPVPFSSPDPLVGGAPSAFRSVFEVRPDLADVTVPCPFTPTCRVRLKDASIAGADLILQPVASPAGFVPELPISVLAYTLQPTPQLPLIRSPLGFAAGFITVGPSSFRGTGQPATPLSVTTFIRDLVTPVDTTAFSSRYLTLLPGGTATFGYASFAGSPKLRLRLSVAQEIQLP
jgi:hypothetical protein